MVAFLSNRIANKLSIVVEIGLVEDMKKLSTKISNVIINYSILLISLATGIMVHNLINTLIGLIVFGLLRTLNGGFHLRKAEHCIFITSSLLVILPLAAPFIENHRYIFLSLAAIFILLFAPTKRSHRTNVRKRKFLSIAICLVVIILNNQVIDAALFVSSMTLIPIRKKR
ncbi:hypothetical protein BC351_10385 [Paenibacillus ferrarius]|uniref:Accessory regulator AgrB n=1 Tax=Paenibacillus ferrarius TaxID=1469647 RepID=A0A1V4H8Q4_9BACL|nr:accessory gene regulator B family protein [Paenibacillus ferrarius]OPH47590.1 hypothetical protein BC351_10385 [Paenibacillus ferrarius]